MTREQALELIKHNSEENDMNHYLESEAVMKELAGKLGEDEEYWAMLGLLHDVDWSLTKEKVETHLTKASEILKGAGFDNDFIETVLSHGYGFEEIPHMKDKKRTEKVQHALAASETVTGLIHAYALMRGKKINDMEAKGLMKKFKDKAFAAKVDREIIRECENLGLSLNEFFEIAIEGIRNIKGDVGLE
ncbi:MAG: HDIG domain-containing protein [Nanoarchaeota archaeon]|nr:HDIG domain-containing protein [Nanoarchaeota archaeon]